MIFATDSRFFLRILCLAILLYAPAVVCFGQSVEQDPVFFDDQQPRLDLTAPLEHTLDLNILNQSRDLHWYSMFTQVPSNWARSASWSLQSESVPAIAGIGVMTYALIRTDNETWKATHKLYRTSQSFSDVSNYAVAMGDGRFHLGVATAFAGYGWLMNDQKSLQVASQTVEAFLATGITVQLLKRITGRESPAVATHHAGRWKFFPHPSLYNQHPTSYYAYPSGHISTAMATLTVIAENYPDQRWIKPTGYVLTGALGVGLVAKGMHWYSDLPMGIALGYLFGKIAAHPSIPDLVKRVDEKGLDISVTPCIDSQGGGGIHLAMAF